MILIWGLPSGTDGKECTCNVSDLGLIPGLGRYPGEGNGYPLQYSGLENSIDRRTWQATARGDAKSQTWLRDFHLFVDCKFTLQSRMKQITSPGWLHETSSRTWCTGKTLGVRVVWEVGGGIGMGNTCKPMADSFQCMTKFAANKKIIINKK